mgnify:FL=1
MKGGEYMKTSYIVIGIVVLVLAGGGFFVLNNSNSSTTENQVATQPNSIQNEAENSQPAAQADDSSLSQRYVDYSEANLAKATENDGKAVLFFAALAWCPSCQAADKDIQANFDKVPADVTILRVDYDTAKDLKQEYAITMQDTFIQVDSLGKEVTRWHSGGQGVKALLASLK